MNVSLGQRNDSDDVREASADMTSAEEIVMSGELSSATLTQPERSREKRGHDPTIELRGMLEVVRCAG